MKKYINDNEVTLEKVAPKIKVRCRTCGLDLQFQILEVKMNDVDSIYTEYLVYNCEKCVSDLKEETKTLSLHEAFSKYLQSMMVERAYLAAYQILSDAEENYSNCFDDVEDYLLSAISTAIKVIHAVSRNPEGGQE